MSKRSLQSTLTTLANIIRAYKTVNIEDLCLASGLAPSTVYQYRKLLLKRYEDITYSEGVFKHEPKSE